MTFSPTFNFFSFVSLVLLVSFAALVDAHMSMWHPSMYGVGPNWSNDGTGAPVNPANPIGPDIALQNDWWFRGPESRALKPQNDSVMTLPAGGKVDLEIACNVAFTSYGVSPSNLSDPLAACPDNSGAFHSGVPGEAIDENLLSGCALAIADKDDIENVGWNDLVVFSVQHRCVRDRVTTFDIPERLPKCRGDKCICAWLWLANNGTGNFYMTGFDCSVEPTANAAPILPPSDPEFCPSTNSTCTPTKGAKRPLYAYNSPSNIVWQGNDNRPGYHESWSFYDGAQNDIFDTSVSSTSAENGTTTSSYSASSRKSSINRTPTSIAHTTSTISTTSSSRKSPTTVATLTTSPSSTRRLSSSSSRSNSSTSTATLVDDATSTESRPNEPISMGVALELAPPTFNRRHLSASHNRRDKRTFITDQLLQSTEESNAVGGRIVSRVLLFVVLLSSLGLVTL